MQDGRSHDSSGVIGQPDPANEGGEHLKTRLATLPDASELSRLSSQLGYSVAVADMASRLRLALASPMHRVIVAEATSALAGWAAAELRLSLESGLRVEISGLIVDATARRSGVGRALVEEIECWAASKGCATILVRSNVAREEAHLFYERLGYECTKAQQVYRRVLDG